MPEPLLQVRDLRIQFQTDDGIVKAVDGISFDLHPHETLGVVGESGSGKSVSSLALLGLTAKPAGRVVAGTAMFQGEDLLRMDESAIRTIRGRRIAMIFQDPMTALNPFLTISEQLTEMTRLHLRHTAKQALHHAIATLELVGIPAAARRVHEYPHQFSGGMRQRVMIAMALLCQPDILIADEPTTALDVTIQAQILELLKEMQQKHGTAIIMITHDLGVVANICHRVQVMYAGRIVEEAPADELFSQPRHPYTRGLLESVPSWEGNTGRMLKAIDGQPPDLVRLPPGCAFEPRCPFGIPRCRESIPPLESVSPSSGVRKLACIVDLQTNPPVTRKNVTAGGASERSNAS